MAQTRDGRRTLFLPVKQTRCINEVTEMKGINPRILKLNACNALVLAIICGILALFNLLGGWAALPDAFYVKDSFCGNIADLQAEACAQVHACFKTLLCIARLFLGWLFTKAAICLGKLSLRLLAKAKGDATASHGDVLQQV